MFHNKPFKKDLTPFAKGGKVVKHVGKGATEQSTRGGRATITGGDPFARMANRYPTSPQDLGAGDSVGTLGGPPMPPSPVPMGSKPPSAPTAMMPPDTGGGEPDTDDAA